MRGVSTQRLQAKANVVVSDPSIRVKRMSWQGIHMTDGGKYRPIHEYLRRCGAEQITMTFVEVEALIRSPLPASARAGRAWWSNRAKGALQAEAWMSAGYHVVDLDLAAEYVTFRKPRPVYTTRGPAGTMEWDAESIRDLRLRLGLSQVRLADELGVRQQTVSEWENGLYTPTRAMSRLLTMVAEQAERKYGEGE